MSCKNMVMQGDQYDLSFSIMIDNEEIDMNEIEKIQFQVGNLLKTFIKDDPESEVTFDATDKTFKFPLTEEETFAFDNQEETCQIRIKFTEGKIKGMMVGPLNLQFGEITEPMDENEEETTPSEEA